MSFRSLLICDGVNFVFTEKLGRNSWRNSVFGINPNIVRDRPFAAALFDDFEHGGGGVGRGSSNTDCRTDGGDTLVGVLVVPSKLNATVRTTARRAKRHGDERVAEVAGRFEGDLGESGAISWLDLRFVWLSGRTVLNEAISEGVKGNSAVGDDVGSMES